MYYIWYGFGCVCLFEDRRTISYTNNALKSIVSKEPSVVVATKQTH